MAASRLKRWQMDGVTLFSPEDGGLANFALLAEDLATLKRLRDARCADSLAAILFHRAWRELCAGEAIQQVALAVTADALAALRLGGIDADVLARAGLSAADAATIRLAAFDQLEPETLGGLRDALRNCLARPMHCSREALAAVPSFVEALIRQPRAGATCPGKPRLVLEPPEGHGDHCLTVAVLGVLLSGQYDADPVPVFLAGLAHHLHNAALPDAGFAGEMLLGAHLAPILRTLRAEAIATLPQPLAEAVQNALVLTATAATPEGRAFNAADVIDRVMEVRHFAAVARFTEAQALYDMALVHEGPLQAFHDQVLRRAGLIAP